VAAGDGVQFLAGQFGGVIVFDDQDVGERLSTRRSSAARGPVITAPVGFCARLVTMTAFAPRCNAAASRRIRPVVVDGDGQRVQPERRDKVEQTGPAGVLPPRSGPPALSGRRGCAPARRARRR
jgi:hypothetical protein